MQFQNKDEEELWKAIILKRSDNLNTGSEADVHQADIYVKHFRQRKMSVPPKDCSISTNVFGGLGA
jgi:hypothetical protein